MHLFEAHEAELAVCEKTRAEVFPRAHQDVLGKRSRTSGRANLQHITTKYNQEYSFQRHNCCHEQPIQESWRES